MSRRMKEKQGEQMWQKSLNQTFLKGMGGRMTCHQDGNQRWKGGYSRIGEQYGGSLKN